MNRYRITTALIIVVSVIFQSCSPSQPATPTAVPSLEISPAPTALPTEIPTSAPTPTDWNAVHLRIATIDENGVLSIFDSLGNVLDSYQVDGVEKPMIQWSPSGEYLLVTENRNVKHVYLIDILAHQINKWAQVPEGIFRFLEWSPASDKLKFDVYSQDGLWTLNLIQRDGSSLQTIYQAWTSVNNTPSWGPEGKFLAVAGSPAGGSHHLYVMEAESGNIIDATPQDVDLAGFGGNWLADGRLIYVAINGDEGSYIVLDPFSLGSSILLKDPPDGVIYGPELSPSGKFVAYSVQTGKDYSPDGNRYGLYIKALDDNSPLELWSIDKAIGVYIDSWSPTEEYLMFTVQTEGSGAQNTSYLLDIKSGNTVPLDGLAFFLIQRNDPFSASVNWINETQFMYEASGDLSSGVLKRVMLYDIITSEQTELCRYIEFGACAIWIN